MEVCVNNFKMSTTGLETNNKGSGGESPVTSGYDSGASSPPQQLATYFRNVCPDEMNVVEPYLRIIEQPQTHFKFRYDTEMASSHGCLHGKSYKKGTNEESFPEVELVGFSGQAIIRCQLVQAKRPYDTHPHKLSAGEGTGSRGIFQVVVPKEEKYIVKFAGLCIINKKTREVQNDILHSRYNIDGLNPQELAALHRECKKIVKDIDLNRVRIKFSAHCPKTDKEICDAIYSDPINDNNNSATSILKICSMSTCVSSAVGGQRVIMLVEKVNKKDIQIRFVEESDTGDVIWEDKGRFLECNVHRQYAIEFKTPPYKMPDLKKRVKVFVELVRPSDKETSERIAFEYVPDPNQINKKRKLAYRQDAGVLSYGNIDQNCSPTTTVCSDQQHEISGVFNVLPLAHNDVPSDVHKDLSTDLGSLFEGISSLEDLSEGFGPELFEMSNWVKDSGRFNSDEEEYDDVTVQKMVEKLQVMVRLKWYMEATSRDKLAQALRDLFDLRMINGDTFLHVTIGIQQPLINYIIQMTHDLNMTYLLNLKNDRMLTILHLAVVNELPNLVTFLLSKGCDPMSEDIEGNNAIHYAVIYQSCLEPLIEFVIKTDLFQGLDAFNDAQQTALHLAVKYKSESSTRLLLQSGASYNARDSEGRTPLHLAAYDDCLPVARSLLDHVLPSDVDEVDLHGYTALQIACSGEIKNNTIEMVKLLLEKNADPTKSRLSSPPAWKLARAHAEIMEVMQPYLPEHLVDFETSTSEDEFESADECDYEDIRGISEICDKMEALESGHIFRSPVRRS